MFGKTKRRLSQLETSVSGLTNKTDILLETIHGRLNSGYIPKWEPGLYDRMYSLEASVAKMNDLLREVIDHVYSEEREKK